MRILHEALQLQRRHAAAHADPLANTDGGRRRQVELRPSAPRAVHVPGRRRHDRLHRRCARGQDRPHAVLPRPLGRHGRHDLGLGGAAQVGRRAGGDRLLLGDQPGNPQVGDARVRSRSEMHLRGLLLTNNGLHLRRWRRARRSPAILRLPPDFTQEHQDLDGDGDARREGADMRDGGRADGGHPHRDSLRLPIPRRLVPVRRRPNHRDQLQAGKEHRPPSHACGTFGLRPS